MAHETTAAHDLTPEVWAAGGVVWRRGDGRETGPEVLLVHRPKYDDWSLPKGKLDPGEGWETAALREIAEETGVDGRLGPSLGEVRYTDHKGRLKAVRWWAVEATSAGRPVDEDEIDALRWVPLDDADSSVDYDTDREVLARFRATVNP
ncbi:NUDIX hydrolase [Euzebya sp.]|uniref:NUDIX hydrolase n=1 Tax=Euzebya sp. TaxID=1971409 RepID=UPI003517F503